MVERRNRGGRRGTRRLAVVLFVLLIWGICILAGFLLAKYLITPMLLSGKKQPGNQPQTPRQTQQTQQETQQTQPSTGTQSSQSQRVSLPSLKLFRVQLGAFSRKENATKLVESVRSKGLSATVVQVGQSYRVVGAYTSSGEGAKAAASTYSRAGFQTFVEATEIAARTATTKADPKVVQRIAEECCKFLQEVATGWDQYYLGKSPSLRIPSAAGVEKALAMLPAGATTDSLAEQLRKLAQSCKEFAAKPGSLPEYMQKFIEMVNQYWFMAAAS